MTGVKQDKEKQCCKNTNEAAELNSSAGNDDEDNAHHENSPQTNPGWQQMISKQPKHQQYNE